MAGVMRTMLACMGAAVMGAAGSAALMEQASHSSQPQPGAQATGPEERPGQVGAGNGTGTGSGRRDGRQFDRAMLSRWLIDLEKRRAVLEEAIKRLDSGESPDAVRTYVREHSPPVPWRGGQWRDGDEAGPGETGDRPPRGGGSAGPVSAEEQEVLLDIIGRWDSEARDRLVALKKDKPEEYERSIAESRRRLRGLLEMRKRDPQLFEIRLTEMESERKAKRQARAVVEQEQAAAPDTAKIDEMRRELRRLVALRQSARIAAQTLELARVQERLDRMRTGIMEQAASHDRVVDEQVAEFLKRATEPEREDDGPRDPRRGDDGAGRPRDLSRSPG